MVAPATPSSVTSTPPSEREWWSSCQWRFARAVASATPGSRACLPFVCWRLLSPVHLPVASPLTRAPVLVPPLVQPREAVGAHPHLPRCPCSPRRVARLPQNARQAQDGHLRRSGYASDGLRAGEWWSWSWPAAPPYCHSHTAGAALVCQPSPPPDADVAVCCCLQPATVYDVKEWAEKERTPGEWWSYNIRCGGAGGGGGGGFGAVGGLTQSSLAPSAQSP